MDVSLAQSYTDKIKQIYRISEPDAFAVWVLLVYHYQNDLAESSVDEAYGQSYQLNQEFGPGDECLDGYYYSQNEHSIYLYQVKFSANYETKYGVSEAREVANALNSILSDWKNNAQCGPARDDVIQSIGKVIEHEGKIILRCVCSGHWRNVDPHKILKQVDSSVRENTEIELISGNDLLEDSARATDDLSRDTISFNLHSSKSLFSLPEPKIEGLADSVVALLSGRSLGYAANKYKSRLFDKNVRTFLGRKSINKEIIDALSDNDTREKFWYAHNGITVLCDDYSIKESDTSEPTLHITNPQIVNGCQTANSLGFAIVELDDGFADVPILARIIKLKGTTQTKEDVAGFIAFGTNNQSPINQADLRANDPRQKHLEKKLANYNPPWFYERKRKGWVNFKRNEPVQAKKFKDKPDRVIERDAYQQAWRSFKGHPADAMIHKGLVWEKTNSKSPGLYEQVFDYDRRAIEIIFVCKLLGWFKEVFTVRRDSSLCIELNSTLAKNLKLISSAKMLVAAHSTSLMGYLIRRTYGGIANVDEGRLRNASDCLDQKTFVQKNWGNKPWAILEPEFKHIMATWSSYCMFVIKDEDTLYRKLKTPQAIEHLEDLLENHIQSHDSKDLFENI